MRKPSSHLVSALQSIYDCSYFILLNLGKKTVIQQKVLSGSWLITQHHPYMVWERLQERTAGAHMSRWAATYFRFLWASLPAGSQLPVNGV